MKRASVREKMGIDSISENGELIYADGSKAVFFKVEPANLSVLSAINIRTKILNLASLAKIMGMMDMYALDDRENYGENRRFIRERIDEEDNPYVRRILEEDEKFIRTIEADSSSARLFLVAFYVPKALEQKFFNQLNHFKQLAAQSLLRLTQLNKSDVKKVIAVYFKHDTTTENFPDFDGMEYYDDVDWDEVRYRIKEEGDSSDDDMMGGIQIPLGK